MDYVGGYTTPGGTTVTPSGGSPPWAGGDPISQLLTGSSPSSLIPGMSGDDISQLVTQIGDLIGSGKQITSDDIIKAVSGLHDMPQWNQVTGSFGSERQLIEQALVSLTEWMHQMGDPTQGRLPQTSQRHRLDLSSLIHPAVASGRQAVFNAIRGLNAGYGPTHSSIAWGGPHPEWWSTKTGPEQAGDVVAGLLVGAGLGALASVATGIPELIVFGALVGVLYGIAKAWGGMPAPDDAGGGGPRSSSYFPSDEGGPVNPRSFTEMPSPDGGTGGPKWFPNPDDTRGAGPRG